MALVAVPAAIVAAPVAVAAAGSEAVATAGAAVVRVASTVVGEVRTAVSAVRAAGVARVAATGMHGLPEAAGAVAEHLGVAGATEVVQAARIGFAERAMAEAREIGNSAYEAASKMLDELPK